MPATLQFFSTPVVLAQVVDKYSSARFRLMAMAVGVIPQMHRLDVQHMSQQEVEARATHMDLLCLLALTNNIRPDSKDTITQLQEG